MPRYRPPKGVTPPQLTPFKPGHKHHPAAQTKEQLKLAKKLAKNRSPEAMRTLIDLMVCGDPRVAYMAATAILDRGMGKPREVESEPESSTQTLDVTKLTPEQRDQLRGIIEQGAVERPVEVEDDESHEITQDDDTSRALPAWISDVGEPASLPAPTIDGDACEIDTVVTQSTIDDDATR